MRYTPESIKKFELTLASSGMIATRVVEDTPVIIQTIRVPNLTPEARRTITAHVGIIDGDGSVTGLTSLMFFDEADGSRDLPALIDGDIVKATAAAIQQRRQIESAKELVLRAITAIARDQETPIPPPVKAEDLN